MFYVTEKIAFISDEKGGQKQICDSNIAIDQRHQDFELGALTEEATDYKHR